MPYVKFGKDKKRLKAKKPDEVFQHGPISFARFGRFIVAKNLAPPEHFKELREKAPQVVAELEATIRSGIHDLRAILRDVDPISFLTNAYGDYFVAHMGVEDEPSLTSDHALALRMLDYCVSLFAAAPLSSERRHHTEEEFKKAKACVKAIFDATRDYVLWSRPPELDKSDKAKVALNELITKLVLQWIFVRSDRHSYFELQHYRAVLDPFDGMLREVLGVSADDLMRGLSTILTNAQSGFVDAGIVLKKAHEASTAHPDFGNIFDVPDDLRNNEIARLAGLDPLIFQEAIESLFGSRLFKVELSTGWPTALIERLSYRPGDAAEFLSPEQTAGWPTRIWPIFRRPFLRIDDYSYCFDYISFFDRFYRQLLRILRETKPVAIEEINWIQSAAVEASVSSLFSKIIPGSNIFRNFHYSVDGQWYECDLALVYKDTILAIEVRSGAFTPSSPDDDLVSYFRSIESLILKPASQAWRLLDGIEKGNLAIFDSDKANKILLSELHRTNFRLRIPVAVSLDHTHMMGAHFANTLAAVEAHATRPTWVLAVDDLRCFAELFDSPTVFLHFAEMRLKAAAEPRVDVHDELDHVGLYFRENDYIQQTLDFEGRLNRVGYTSEIDKYFFALGSSQPAEKPKQSMRTEIQELISGADRSQIVLSRLFVSQILDEDDETRSEIATWIEHQRLNPAESGRFRLFSLFFETTIICLEVATSWSKPSKAQAFDEAKARLLKSNNSEKILVALLRVERTTIIFEDCVEILKANISDMERERLRPISEAQMKRDFSKVTHKLGRNDACPCGSGLKYKKCCLNRRGR